MSRGLGDVYKRQTLYPIKHLFPLELSLTHSGGSVSSAVQENGNPNPPPSGVVPSPSSNITDHTTSTSNMHDDQPSCSYIPVQNISQARSLPVRKTAAKAKEWFLTLDESDDSE